MTIPASAIRLSYLWDCNAAQAAVKLWGWYGVPITERALRIRWENECEDHPVLRDLGQRPVKGFDATDERVILAQKLLKEDA